MSAISLALALLCPSHLLVLTSQLTTMRNLIIYISALCVLAEGHAFDHGAAQLRDLLAHPKYEVQFLNDLPVSQSDADRANTLGLEREEEWLDLRLSLDRQRVGDGMSVPSEVRPTSSFIIVLSSSWDDVDVIG